MKPIYGVSSFLIVLGLSACGKQPTIDDLKATVGMSKDQVESKFGEPKTSSPESTDTHPGGYWVYQASSGASCKLHFDLPPRVVGTDC
jgi:outer membrane protein assembly factor BamE (lipoprotein component of BamABCDE complex)